MADERVPIAAEAIVSSLLDRLSHADERILQLEADLLISEAARLEFWAVANGR